MDGRERETEREREREVAKCGVLEDLRQTAPPGYTTNGREIVEKGRETERAQRSRKRQLEKEIPGILLQMKAIDYGRT